MAEEQLDIRIPGHRILRQLGSGGMANVYLAFQESMEREVALKVMHPSLGITDPAFGERFVREAKIVAKLTHPHINAVHDVGISGPHRYITMEYITGGDLRSRIRHGMPPQAALAVVHQIASALAFAHSKGYIHRDVKPENVLFRDSGTAVLTDFGIAKTNDVAGNKTATGIIIGTPHYMSPEQAMGRAIDKRSDLYSLGAMLFEMLTGKVPYSGDSAISVGIKHLKDPIPRLPPPLQAYQPLLDKFMAKDPAHRFQTGEETIAAIDAHAHSGTTPVGMARTVVFGPGTAGHRTVQTGATEPKRRRYVWVAALLVPLVAGAGYFALRKPARPVPVAVVPTVPAAVPASAAPRDEAAARAAEVAQLLTEAKAATDAGHFLDPIDSAAVPKLRRALALDPGNARAARGLNEIAGRIVARAERAIEAKAFDQAETLLKQAEAVDASHPMLFSRRLALNELRQRQATVMTARAERKAEPAGRRLTARPVARAAADPPAATAANVEDASARAQRERELKLQDLLSRFRDLTTPDSLSAPRAALAQELLEEATRLAPGDGRVRVLSGQLADAYLKLATSKAEQREYDEAGALARRGLLVRPNHGPLLALQRDIAEKRNPKPQTFGSF